MSTLLTADIHLNDKPRDEYRWSLFQWLSEQEADELVINGDLTDAKDRHSAKLVNRLFSEIMKLEPKFRVIINRGNHDYYDVDHPFFQFLGSSSDCLFVTKPTQLKMSIGSAFFVPAGVRWDFEIPEVDYLFTHATFSGAKAENGRTLTGVDPGVLKGFKGRVISGDIHTPQKLNGGQIEYCGAPFNVRFGDEYDPRVMLVANDGTSRDLHFPAPRKHVFTVTEPDHLLDEKAGRGDHVKVRCLLRRADYDRWRDYQKKIREIADERGWLLFGSEPVPLEVSSRNDSASQVEVAAADQLVENYAREQKASRAYAEAGARLLKEGVS